MTEEEEDIDLEDRVPGHVMQALKAHRTDPSVELSRVVHGVLDAEYIIPNIREYTERTK